MQEVQHIEKVQYQLKEPVIQTKILGSFSNQQHKQEAVPLGIFKTQKKQNTNETDNILLSRGKGQTDHGLRLIQG